MNELPKPKLKAKKMDLIPFRVKAIFFLSIVILLSFLLAGYVWFLENPFSLEDVVVVATQNDSDTSSVRSATEVQDATQPLTVEERLARVEVQVATNTVAIASYKIRFSSFESRLGELETKFISLVSQVEKNTERLDKMSSNLKSSVVDHVHKLIGKEFIKTKYVSNDVIQPTSLYVGPFNPGSASGPDKKLAEQMATLKRSLVEPWNIKGVKHDARVVAVIGFHDKDPIKKSHWASNAELARARAMLVASAISFDGRVEISNDPEVFGLSDPQNRGVHVYLELTPRPREVAQKKIK